MERQNNAETRNLVLHFTGTSQDENLKEMIDDVFKEEFQRLPPMTVSIYPADQKGSAQGLEENDSDLRLLRGMIYPKSSNTVIDMIVRYPGDAHQWIKDGRYPDEAVQLMDDAAIKTAAIIKDFKQSYPDGRITAMAICIGGEVLLRSIEKSATTLDKVFFFSPPIRDESAFNQTLLQHGYDGTRVTVITAVGDEVTPIRLTGGGRNAFTLIEKQKE